MTPPSQPTSDCHIMFVLPAPDRQHFMIFDRCLKPDIEANRRDSPLRSWWLSSAHAWTASRLCHETAPLESFPNSLLTCRPTCDGIRDYTNKGVTTAPLCAVPQLPNIDERFNGMAMLKFPGHATASLTQHIAPYHKEGRVGSRAMLHIPLTGNNVSPRPVT
jgi:hypothetical protein